MFKFNKALLYTLVASSLVFGATYYRYSANYYGKLIKKIVIIGNRNTPKDEILDVIEPLGVGVHFTRSLSNTALKNLFRLESFSNVWLEAEALDKGVLLRFVVQELPRIDTIEIIGADKVYENELTELIDLKEGDVITPSKIASARQAILGKYYEEGLFMAYIKIKQNNYNKKENTVDVSVLIDEGEDILVTKINVLGTDAVDAEDLVDRMELKEEGFIDDGTFKESSFEKDKQLILEFYKEKGYLDVELVDSRWDIKWNNYKEKEKRVIHVNYHVKEGDLYYYDGYDISHDVNYLSPRINKGITDPKKKKPVYTISQIREFMEYTEGDIGQPFNNAQFQRDKGIINYLYSQKGYIYTRVIPTRKDIILTTKNLNSFTKADDIKKYHIKDLKEILAADPSKNGRKFVYHSFTIQEGDIAYVENILIKGNSKTMDKVIRRELLINPGDLFNSQLVQRSRERVHNLGFFKEVNLDMRPGSDDGLMNLIISVVEQPTGTISLGGGYGTQTGFSIFLEVGENNLQGTGQRVKGRVEFGPQRRSFEVSWTEPWLFDRPWSLTLSTYYLSQNIQTRSVFDQALNGDYENTYYSKNSFGFGVGIGHRFWVNWGHYHWYKPRFSVASEPTGLVEDIILQEVNLGWQFKSAVLNGIYYDNRDNVFNTTSGFRASLDVEVVGGIFGGQDHYNRYSPEAQYYFWPFDFTFFNLIRSNTLRRWRAVFEFRASGAFTHTTAPVYSPQRPDKNPYIQSEDMLYLGGYESLRGWDYYDRLFPTVWQDGGMHRILFSTEFRIPVEPSLLWLVVYFDSGALYENAGDIGKIENLSGTTYTEGLDDYTLRGANLALSRFRYSYGFGFRLQIPILPLRLYLGKRLEWDAASKRFRHPTGLGGSDFNFVFGIGDRRF